MRRQRLIDTTRSASALTTYKYTSIPFARAIDQPHRGTNIGYHAYVRGQAPLAVAIIADVRCLRASRAIEEEGLTATVAATGYHTYLQQPNASVPVACRLSIYTVHRQ